jgi:acetyl-CoA C-acetyltransferase
MSFAGGPWNNYVMHGIATMMGVLRSAPGTFGLCTGNGGYTTKHSFGVYATQPPASGAFRHDEPQDAVDALPRREPADPIDAEVAVEAYTVMHDRDGVPERALLACLLDDGRRAWGRLEDPAVMAALMTEEFVGRRARIGADGRIDAR